VTDDVVVVIVVVVVGVVIGVVIGVAVIGVVCVVVDVIGVVVFAFNCFCTNVLFLHITSTMHKIVIIVKKQLSIILS